MKITSKNGLLGYDRSLLKFDVIAGVTVAAVVIPKSLAYTVIAGLPVEVGLYTALVLMVVYALLGTSRNLSVSGTSTIAILIAAQLANVAGGGSPGELITAAATLAFLSGAFLCLAAVLRLGFLAYFISAPVLTGFKAGIGVVIIVDQLPKILGIHIDKADFFRNLLSILQHLPQTHLATLAVGAGGLLMVVLFEKFRPRSPAPLFAVVTGIAASFFLGLSTMGVSIVGNIPSGLPRLSLPDWPLLITLWPGALGIALMSFTESIAAERAFLEPGSPNPDLNRELFALGAANLLGGLFQAMPGGGGTSQTAVNRQAGARTQGASLVTAACTLLVMLFLAPVVALMPLCILAAVVIVTTAPLISPAEFNVIRHVRKKEFYWSLTACAGVIILGTLVGILVAVVLSLLMIMYQANHPPVYLLGRKKGTQVYRNLELYPQDEQIPGLLIVRTEGMLTFASIPRAADKYNSLKSGREVNVLLLDLSAVPDIEYTALMHLEEAERKMAREGTRLWVSGLNRRVLETVRRTALGTRLEDGRLFDAVEEAVEYYIGTSENPG